MSELRNQVPVVLSTDLILELLANGYTRFQDENTFENESIETFLIENFPNIFNVNNVKGQIRIMFSKAPLKGKRTQKVERQLFEWGTTQEIVGEPIEEIPAEYLIQEEEDVDVAIQEEKSDVLIEELVDNSENMTEEEVQREEELQLAPWEEMG